MRTTTATDHGVPPSSDGADASPEAPAASEMPETGVEVGAPPPPPGTRDRRRLGEILVDAGIISDRQVIQALEQKAPEERLGQTLIRLEYTDENSIADAVAAQLGIARVNPELESIDPEALELLPPKLAERHGLLPLRLDAGRLLVATSDPADLVALDDVRVASGVRALVPCVATASAIDRVRRRAYREDQAGEALGELEATYEEPDESEADAAAEDKPVVRLVDGIISDAVNARASDIHVEPDADGVSVRLRVDGLLRESRRLPRLLGRQVVSRLKIMGRVDIAERRLPQDGRAMTRVEGQEIDLRISTMPTMYGETVVLRLLPRGAERIELDHLGLSSHARTSIVEALHRPQGLVLVTGPTGSGKTSTLYASLTAVSDPTRNVLTLEDPVEVQLPGVNQTQVEPRIGLTFARGLRHVLRQDPDVVLVGEIRDEETARLAVEASFTGHLVLATLHTNDAPSAVARLTDLGADPFLVASSLLLVVGQRLARSVCDNCSVRDEPAPGVIARSGLRASVLDVANLRRGSGCPMCEHTGVRGRTAIGEVLPVSGPTRDLIVARSSERSLTQQARSEGMATMREEAIQRALEGRITLEEALRVTPDPTEEALHCTHCEATVAEDHLACANCGHDLVAAGCGGCGRAIDDDWNTCPWCRHQLAS